MYVCLLECDPSLKNKAFCYKKNKEEFFVYNLTNVIRMSLSNISADTLAGLLSQPPVLANMMGRMSVSITQLS